MRFHQPVSFALAAGLVAGCVGSPSDETILLARLDGAIFTTLVDGSRVDANIYQAKTDVYLDGGPGNNAPQKAAGLPDGDYYFMVTDPSGKTLLSTDAIECRRVAVEDGIIVRWVAAAGCSHLMGSDQDHGAATVQLMPYADTPNPGGEYKAWMTPVDKYDATSKLAVHGFIHSESKTDNFKVRAPVVAPPPEEPPPPPPCSCCGDGTVGGSEQCDDGNHVDGDGCSSTCTIEEPPPPPPPAPCCGDGNVDEGEECDDGNTTSGDGCSEMCAVETTCPSTCTGEHTCPTTP